jgi:hypothetical protein
MKQLEQIQENLVSYSLIVAGFVVYLGMRIFTLPIPLLP